jgi:formate-dependent nitrite reductase membrane component NrfD
VAPPANAHAAGRPELGATRLPREHGTSPYGRPVIKPPVWKPAIPLYFYTGGLAGASAGVGLLCELRGEQPLARRAWAVALAGSAASPALLISDLGVPARFLHMLRMFKVTSPMSVGSWILAGFGAATAPAAAHSLTGGRLGAPGRAAQVAAAVLGLPLSSYTAALIANTAVPVWHEARGELPFLFTAGAAASAGAALTALSPLAQAGPARRLAVGGAAAELVVAHLMEHRLAARGLGGAYGEPDVKRLSRGATLMTAAGAALIAGGGARSRAAAVAGGALLSGGALAERWTVFRAGTRSAQRPQDTIAPQRARIARGETRGAARTAARRSPERTAGDGHRPGERPVPPGSPAIPPRTHR